MTVKGTEPIPGGPQLPADASPELVVLIGPTASGKSALAIALARRLGAEILTVDSMQVYRGMDIGTAKPTSEEQRDVRHHLIDVVEPTESFTVARFVELADGVIGDARSRGVRLIVAGGTPMYFKALFDGLFEGPGANPELRARLNAESLHALHARLREVDPAAAQRIHVNDRKRLVRALEVFELTGRPISQLQEHWISTPAGETSRKGEQEASQPAQGPARGRRRHQARWFGLSWDREALNRRINSRVRQMIDAGWREEVCGLLGRYATLSQTAAEATGYAELIEHVRGAIPLDAAVEQIKIATRQLARRQMKWFRRFEDVSWLPGDRTAEENAAAVLTMLGGR